MPRLRPATRSGPSGAASAAGMTNSAPAEGNRQVAEPAYPKLRRNEGSNSSRALSETATVRPLKRMVRPAVATETAMASSWLRPAWNSSR